MTDPVVAADGQTYERREIEKWFTLREAQGRPCDSPMCGGVLAHKMLNPNVAVCGLMIAYLEQHGLA